MVSPISASQSSMSAACVALPFKKPFEEDSDTPFEMWSSSISTSLLNKAKHFQHISLISAYLLPILKLLQYKKNTL